MSDNGPYNRPSGKTALPAEKAEEPTAHEQHDDETRSPAPADPPRVVNRPAPPTSERID